jgi:hypothetical protein
MILRFAVPFFSPSTSHERAITRIVGRWLGDEFQSKNGQDGDQGVDSVITQPKKKKGKHELTDNVDACGKCTDNKFDASEWKIISSHNPMQTNGFDCGVFVVLFMDLLMLGVPLLFGPEDTSLMRKKLTLQILNARAESARKVVDVD